VANGISIGLELEVLSDAIDAARLPADEITTEHFGREQDFRRAPKLIEAVLALAVARLDLLQRAIGGGVDPRCLATAYNQPLPLSDDPEQQDLILDSWSQGHRADIAKAELRRVKRAKGGQK